MRPKDEVLAVYPHAYINGDGPRPNNWRVYASIDERAKEDALILGHSGSPAGAWSNAARSEWVAGALGVPASPPKVSDEDVLAWAKRHDLSCWDHITEARAAFEDAQTLHLTLGVKTCDGGRQ